MSLASNSSVSEVGTVWWPVTELIICMPSMRNSTLIRIQANGLLKNLCNLLFSSLA